MVGLDLSSRSPAAETGLRRLPSGTIAPIAGRLLSRRPTFHAHHHSTTIGCVHPHLGSRSPPSQLSIRLTRRGPTNAAECESCSPADHAHVTSMQRTTPPMIEQAQIARILMQYAYFCRRFGELPFCEFVALWHEVEQLLKEGTAAGLAPAEIAALLNEVEAEH